MPLRKARWAIAVEMTILFFYIDDMGLEAKQPRLRRILAQDYFFVARDSEYDTRK